MKKTQDRKAATACTTDITPGPAIHLVRRSVLVHGFWQRTKEYEERPVKVMAVAERYAMVRCKECAPYVARVSELAQSREKDGQHVR